MNGPVPGGPPLVRLPDGTVKQVSPITGTVVWTVPGRSHRPIPSVSGPIEVLGPGDGVRACAFCADRYLETPPERARLVRGPLDPHPESGGAGAPGSLPGLPPEWRVLRDLPAEQLGATVADFRRFANLYPILPVQYWRADHGFEPARSVVDRARAYVGTPLGRTHVVGLLRARARHAEGPQPDPASLTDAELVDASIGLFASAHDLVVARRHFRDAARTDDQLCSAGDLAPEEHRAFLALTIEALHDLTRSNPSARYVSVFQNWLRPAGASFDHLHKQLVAIDEWGPLMVRVVDLLRDSPDLFNHAVLDVAARERLVIAENDGAVAVAGIGHRYPTIEIYATAPAARPWEHEPDVVHAVSDLLHACHAATGPRIPTNEEWHYRPRDADVAMPWRINLKWRVSTLAGFEGGTRINVNTIDPFTLRDTVVSRLADLRADGQVRVARIGDECPHRSGLLPPGG